MTVFVSLCFDIICTCRYVRPEVNARMMVVLRMFCRETRAGACAFTKLPLEDSNWIHARLRCEP
jgi:hypothetical protein